MANAEGVENYINRVNDIVEDIKGVGGTLDEGDVIRNHVNID